MKKILFPRGSVKHFVVLLTLFSLFLIKNAFAVFTIPPKPLFLANDVQANIFFALDDSGSMDSEVLNTDEANAALESLIPFNSIFGAVLGLSQLRLIDLSPDEWFMDLDLCPAYNLMTYDPAQTYTPWSGVNNSGVAYADQSISSALNNPFNPAEGSTNLLNIFDDRIGQFSNRPAWYSTFVDNGSCRTDLNWNNAFNSISQARSPDGEMQLCECLSAPVTATFYRDRFDFIESSGDSRFFRVDDLSSSEQTNYANWFTYYRKREYVMKRAMSQLITTSQARMGLATLQNNNGVGTAITDMTNPSNKSNLMANLFQITPSGGTPLRTTLRDVGRYFDTTDSASHSALGFDNASPILSQSEGGECQQNFNVLFSDGFWNGANPSDIGNEDGDGNSDFDGGPHGDFVSPTLADVAMKYYEKDLSTTLGNNVPTITGVDENSAQHLVTYTVSYGLNGTLSAIPANHDPSTPPPPWPTPAADSETTVDDMQHAAFNARGLYLPGQNPQQLIDTLSAALADIGSRTGSASAAASTSQSVKTDALIFQGTFNSEDWSGTFSAFPINTEGVIGAAQWEASLLIPTESSRKIFSFDKSASSPSGIEFQFSQLSSSQKTTIGPDAENIVNYIRGKRSLEIAQGGTMRNRNSLLGDIVHSTPVAITGAQASAPFDQLPGLEGGSYNTHLATKSGITDTVFVGSNDGMLHVFDANSGEEVMAYVPEGVFGKLSSLTDPTYDHDFYVDGVLTASDAFIGGVWKNVVVGTLGRGGNTIFAIDTANISSPTTNNILWEFADPEMGKVIGKPQIARLNNGSWVVVIGNGYNSSSEKPELFIIDLASGTLLKKIVAGSTGEEGNNGLGTPLVVDTNGDFIADSAYAGDLKGNLWKFDLSSSSADSWTVAMANIPLYKAVSPSGTAQPITTKPIIASHPQGGFLILFGTGKFFSQGDEIVDSGSEGGVAVNSFYGIRDNGSPVSSVTSRALPPNGQPNSILQPQSILSESSQTIGTETSKIRITSNNSVDYSSQNGWYMDLVVGSVGPAGERVIADPQIRTAQTSALLLFNTFVPGGSCQSVGGSSALMAIDALTGSRTSFAVFDLNNDGTIDSSDNDPSSGLAVSGRVGQQSVSAVTVISSGDATESYVIQSSTQSVNPTVSTVTGASTSLGRQSWRQLQ